MHSTVFYVRKRCNKWYNLKGMKLKGKTALVTGGSKGIGKAIAKSFAKEGGSVIICGRTEEALRGACEEISKYGEIGYIKADIVNKDDVERLAARLLKKWDKLDILVNNASILGDRVSISEYPEDTWEKVIEVNLNAQFFVTKAVLPLLLKSPNASIINVSSSVGRRGKAFWGAYAVSKFGLEGLTQVLADELKSSNVRVNSINPGGTRTEMRAEAYPDEDPMTLPAPEEITPVFLYLASDESIGVTGKEFDAREWIGKV
ncbi:MAG TPA: YciK family oxidoreductase [Thermodesulfobacteriota bacterium]|nr:YciK family oxidoreductase [Thermodesulfobacteriota bacterium]